jgi:opacity protein-like surface antigen
MRKLMMGAVAAAALATAAPAAANDDPAKVKTETAAQQSASAACKAERTALGVQAFRQKYGTNKTRRNAFGKCVSKMSKQTETQQQATVQTTVEASEACKTERTSLGEDAFAQKYGTNHNKKNAFGKCVSAQSKDAPEATPAS